ncbi:unnamed protein product [marine sediment metagenome]|uniref:Uncharacterized protein n=1 Tax=marine sediment metagenome TaxID=412755 RepID=X0U1G7_9ZZZZ
MLNLKPGDLVYYVDRALGRNYASTKHAGLVLSVRKTSNRRTHKIKWTGQAETMWYDVLNLIRVSEHNDANV